jgi:integrase/recombinase XerD
MTKRVVIYNENTYTNLVKKENKEILNDYILEMKSKRKAVKTIEQYVFDIKMFLCWAHDELDNKSILRLKKRDFRRFFLGMQERGASAARINRVQCSLRNMLEFCVEDDDVYEDYEINAMRSIKGVPKEEVREIVFLSNDQITKIVDYLVEKEDYQKALYLTLSYESAGRRNEVYQVEKHDFLNNKKTNQVVGKRGKKFSLLYFDKSRELAQKWFEKRGEDEITSLWVVGKGENKRQASYEALYDWTTRFRDILEELEGTYLEFNPHGFRHAALENYKDGSHYVLKELGKETLPIEVLKVLANHDSIETTQSYLKNKDEEILNEAFGL